MVSDYHGLVVGGQVDLNIETKWLYIVANYHVKALAISSDIQPTIVSIPLLHIAEGSM